MTINILKYFELRSTIHFDSVMYMKYDSHTRHTSTSYGLLPHHMKLHVHYTFLMQDIQTSGFDQIQREKGFNRLWKLLQVIVAIRAFDWACVCSIYVIICIWHRQVKRIQSATSNILYFLPCYFVNFISNSVKS